jgi:predicted dehydrogenase
MRQSKRTRRDFLKTTAGVTAASMAGPYFFTAAAKADEPKSERLVVASIGVGGRGSDIGRQAALLGNTVACADVHLGNAHNFANMKEIGGKCQVYQDYRKVLDRKDVQAVTIGTPDHWHIKVATDALAAGKDVYCEKPLTLTIDESRMICKAVKASGRVFQVGTQQRTVFGHAFLEAVAIARGGRLGKKLAAKACVDKATIGGPFENAEPPKELDFNFWLGQAPTVPFCPNRIGWNFRWWYDYSGGQVTDWGVHHTDIALWALGGEKTGVAEVECKGSEFPLGRQLTLDYLLGKKSVADLPNKYNVAERFDCNMRLPNGNTINLNSVGNDIHIAGEKGHLRVNRGGIHGKIVDELKNNPTEKAWLDAEVAKLYRGKLSDNEDLGHMENFFNCVKDRSLPISDVYSHCNSVNACHMANISMLLGRKVQWDSQKQEFIDDDEANQLTRRKEREPYVIKV